MKLTINILALFLATLITTALAGGFKASCEVQKATFVQHRIPDPDRYWMELPCRSRNGKMNLSAINLNSCFGNSGGRLVWPGSNFLGSCQDVSTRVSGEKVVMSARCQKAGVLQGGRTEIDLNFHVTNIDGFPVCDR
ncbi:Cyanovirin-N [Ascobolus immersus RN42]|uniref:Cyanovirin-N n=1 Tax=Ascobolus immersus RN42 TaxID=1160509 RepID=A0A3N4I1J9_ASCIM|nr:Cyanovirin-N [Ascobolus immersus RN42]